MAEVAEDIKQLGDKIVGLTLKQAVDLAGYLKDTYNIEPAAGGAVMMAGPAGGGAAAAPAEEAKTHLRRRPQGRRRKEDPGHQGRPRSTPAWV